MQLAIVAAGSRPARRPSCAARWPRGSARAGSGHFESAIVRGMRERGYRGGSSRSRSSADPRFGEYGSRSPTPRASRCSSTSRRWLKRHERRPSAAALLNSQPMGFYAPSQLVQDARRHGVEVRPADAHTSEWTARWNGARTEPPALRLRAPRRERACRSSGGQRLVEARAARGSRACRTLRALPSSSAGSLGSSPRRRARRPRGPPSTGGVALAGVEAPCRSCRSRHRRGHPAAARAAPRARTSWPTTARHGAHAAAHPLAAAAFPARCPRGS